jgi:radical SAM superfamily enzyme YgiQ (UPF0313 family)
MIIKRRVALIAAPWTMYNYPSFQLAILEDSLSRHAELSTTQCSLFFRIAEALGAELYSFISDDYWLAETLGAMLLYGNTEERKEIVCQRASELEAEGNRFAGKFLKTFDSFYPTFERVIATAVESYHFENFDAACLTIGMNQLNMSLFVARQIKDKNPNVVIILGGASCRKGFAEAAVANFSFIDHVVVGPGEIVLPELLLQPDKGKVIYSDSAPAMEVFKRRGALNFDEYYEAYNASVIRASFTPTIIMELSRGCVWNKCSFCSYSELSERLILRKFENAFAEILAYADKYKCLRFILTDSSVPESYIRRINQHLQERGLDIYFYGEIMVDSSILSDPSFYTSRKWGYQIGIENITDRILRRLNKRQSAIDCLYAMKMAEKFGVVYDANLLTRVPGAGDEEVAELLMQIEYFRYYRPLNPNRLLVELGSELHLNLEKAGELTDHPYNCVVFPELAVADHACFLYEYSGSLSPLWDLVDESMLDWMQYYKSKPEGGYLLSLRKGPSFTQIDKVVDDHSLRRYNLTGLAEAIYLFCMVPSSLDEIMGRFRSDAGITEILDTFVREKIMLAASGKYLSLAIDHPRPTE